MGCNTLLYVESTIHTTSCCMLTLSCESMQSQASSLSFWTQKRHQQLPCVELSEPSKYDDGDPRQALEQFGSLFSKVQAIFLEGSSWDNDTLEAKTEEFVRLLLLSHGNGEYAK